MRAQPEAADGGLEDLFEELHDDLVRFAYLLVGSRADAEDVAQAAFASLAERWHAVANHRAYLRQVVVNRAADLHRRAYRQPPARPQPVLDEPEVDEMWSAVQALPAHQRAVVVLRFYEDLTLVQIAELLDRPRSTVRSDLRRALSQLRKELANA